MGGRENVEKGDFFIRAGTGVLNIFLIRSFNIEISWLAESYPGVFFFYFSRLSPWQSGHLLHTYNLAISRGEWVLEVYVCMYVCMYIACESRNVPRRDGMVCVVLPSHSDNHVRGLFFFVVVVCGHFRTDKTAASVHYCWARRIYAFCRLCILGKACRTALEPE
jgi:hypothetical protein